MIAALLLAASITAAPPKVQWVIYTHPPTCIPCRRFEVDSGKLKRAGWTFGEHGDFRIVDVGPHHKDPIPTFVLRRHGKEIERVEGYPPMTLKKLTQRLNEENRKP